MIPDEIGPYRVVAKIGSGAHGVVLLAEQDAPRRRVALKVLAEHAHGERARRRLEHEIALLGRLQHRGIARILEGGWTDDGRPYFAMEHVDGRDLKSWCADERRSERDRIAAVARVADAIDHAHRRGVVHRDLSPRNVLVTPAGDVKVVDFGVALASDELRDEGDDDVVGSPDVMSPEQAAGAPGDERSDVYALGALLHIALTGAPPHAVDGIATVAALRRIRDEHPAPIGRRDRRWRGDLEAIVDRALAKEPADRYPTAAAFADDLRRYLAGTTISVRSPGSWERLARLGRRHPAARGAAVLVLSALLVATTAAGLGTWRSRVARRAADEEAAALLRLSDDRALEQLVRDADTIWPAWPENIPAMRTWLDEAEALVEREPVHRATLGRWEIDGEDGAVARWRRALLVELLAGLDALRTGEGIGTVTEMRERIVRAERAARRRDDEHAEAWARAVEAIAASPVYSGLRIEAQLDLLPLAPDRASGLWEFLHIGTGAAPRRDTLTERWQVQGDTGVVLVLLPGGEQWFGAQRHEPRGFRYDSQIDHDGGPARVTLEPYFVSKYELTQAQWVRAGAPNPSYFHPGWSIADETCTWANPVELVAVDEAQRVLRRLGLEVPTDVQWEYAARGGTHDVWYTGDEPATLQGHANLKDRCALRVHASETGDPWAMPTHDGRAVPAPVGLYAPNPFGLHDVVGNVSEYVLRSDVRRRMTPAEDETAPSAVGVRGGGSHTIADRGRLATERVMSPTHRSRDVGVRPARRLRRTSTDA